MSTSGLRAAIVGSTAALLLAACATAGPVATSPAPSAAAPTRGGNFVMALSSDVATLDPAHAGYDFASWSMTIAVYSALVDYDQGLNLKGDLASSWTVSPDGMTYTFHLRPGVKFSDGTPLTSDDVRYTIERILDPKTASEGSWVFQNVVGADKFASGTASHVSGVQTLDPSTVTIELTAPEPYFLNLLAMPYGRVVKASQVQKFASTFSNHPLGSGPFMLQEWTAGQKLVLGRNANYYDPTRPYLDSVTVLLNQNDQTRILEFERGQLSISDIPSAAYVQITTDPKYKPYLVTSKDPDTYFIGMKTNQHPFDNALVRQALNYAVNKKRLVQLLNGRGVVSHGVIPPSMAGYDPHRRGYQYDPSKARTLLAQAGFPNGFSTELWTINDETSTRVVQSVANDLSAVGVKADIRAVDSSTFYSVVGDAKKVPMFLTFWWQDFPDPYDFFSNLLTKTNWGPNNASYYSNPTVEDGVAKTAHMLDQGQRVALFQSMESTVVRDAPWIFLYHTLTVDVHQPNVYFYLHPVHIWRFADYWMK